MLFIFIYGSQIAIIQPLRKPIIPMSYISVTNVTNFPNDIIEIVFLLYIPQFSMQVLSMKGVRSLFPLEWFVHSLNIL